MRAAARCAALVVGLLPASGLAQPVWHVEADLGVARSFGSTLKLEQDGFDTLSIDARWSGRSLESPLYYAWRVARETAARAWALRFVHLKVHLENTTPEVERFSVSHGYNLLTLEHGFELRGLWLWVGAGLVVAHPESTVRQQTRPENTGGPFGGGYFLTGPTAAVAASSRLALGSRVGLIAEGRLTLSRARIPIADGEAWVPNTAVHVLVGLDLRL